MDFIVIWGAVALISAVVAGFIAPTKNRDYSSWAAWTFLVPPLLIVLLLLPKNVGPRKRQPTLDQLDHREDRI